VLFKQQTLEAIAAGQVTLAFRVWRKPTVKAGGRLTTPVGVLSIETVERVKPDAIKDSEARRAGHRSRVALLKELPLADGDIYKIAFRRIGADPRVALRQDAKLTKTELKRVIAELNRLDKASKGKPWTAPILRLIEKYPARRAPDLAASRGEEVESFKRNVRKLGKLGLTESLEVGYRLSPRGRAVLAALPPVDPTAPVAGRLIG
jgi:hypothetical protein